MSKTARSWLRIAFLLSFFAVGIPYWLIPYSKLNLPSALMEPGLLVVAGAGLMLRLYVPTSFWRIVIHMSAAVPAAVFARVIYDGFKDATSHNLWPFELVIALLLGIWCAFAGAIMGSLLATLVSRYMPGRKS